MEQFGSFLMLFIQPFRANYYKRKLPYTQSPSYVLSVQPEADQNSSKSSPVLSQRHVMVTTSASECWKAASVGNIPPVLVRFWLDLRISPQICVGLDLEQATSHVPAARTFISGKFRLTAVFSGVIPSLVIFKDTASRAHYMLWDLPVSILSMPCWTWAWMVPWEPLPSTRPCGAVSIHAPSPFARSSCWFQKLSAILEGNLSTSECVPD